jgi:hypothetical protein
LVKSVCSEVCDIPPGEPAPEYMSRS